MVVGSKDPQSAWVNSSRFASGARGLEMGVKGPIIGESYLKYYGCTARAGGGPRIAPRRAGGAAAACVMSIL